MANNNLKWPLNFESPDILYEKLLLLNLDFPDTVRSLKVSGRGRKIFIIENLLRKTNIPYSANSYKRFVWQIQQILRALGYI